MEPLQVASAIIALAVGSFIAVVLLTLLLAAASAAYSWVDKNVTNPALRFLLIAVIVAGTYATFLSLPGWLYS